MLYWALMFLVVALIAGVLGFTGVAIAAAGIAKLLFLVCDLTSCSSFAPKQGCLTRAPVIARLILRD